jgi:hypothetical protein
MKTRKLGHSLSLVARLAMGGLAVAPAALSATTLVACADENDPKTWVKRLDDPARRSESIKRLGEFFESAMRKANNNRDADEVKQLRDVIAEPMSKTYAAGGLDDKTRKELIKIVADLRDERTFPALTKAFNDYEAGKSDEDVKYAADSLRGMADAGKAITDQAVVDALWTCFSKFSPTKSKSIQTTQAIHDAMLAVKHPSWGPKAVEKLGAPVLLEDPPPPVNDQLDFWQLTAVQIISALQYKPAARALVGVMMTRNKLKIMSAAKTALLKMPKEATPLLAAALLRTDPDFEKFHADWGADKGYVIGLLDVLSYISTNDAKAAVLAAAGAMDNDGNRRAFAQSLVLFPPDPKVTETFKAVYNQLPPLGQKADEHKGAERSGLLGVVAEFQDPTLVPWLLKEMSTAKGDFEIAAPLNGMQSAIKLMMPDQKKAVGDALAGLEAKKMSKEEKSAVDNLRAAFDLASAVMDKCQKDVSCYVKALEEPVPSQPPTANWKAIKAANMAAMLGNDATRGELLAVMPKVTNPGARLAVASAIDHLAPNGDTAGADALDKIVKNDEENNKELLKADDALVKVALRLRARAGQ